MAKEKKVKKTQVRNIPKFEDIEQATQSEQEPQRKFDGTIEMGKCDETIQKIILEENKEEL